MKLSVTKNNGGHRQDGVVSSSNGKYLYVCIRHVILLEYCHETGV
ncbi:MAG: hypothetical protein ORN55_02240 [Chitinophagaceae bacterium]|nr:hypothetical protein [Chitinophagaceae bacterium]